mmetsp:Transcript_2774/g.6667  ORF Transcript_2774/g.6667 Transcript_2774/m.6667 type:complete len:205 (-) Transcript_2774:1181-1795(-)
MAAVISATLTGRSTRVVSRRRRLSITNPLTMWALISLHSRLEERALGCKAKGHVGPATEATLRTLAVLNKALILKVWGWAATHHMVTTTEPPSRLIAEPVTPSISPSVAFATEGLHRVLVDFTQLLWTLHFPAYLPEVVTQINHIPNHEPDPGLELRVLAKLVEACEVLVHHSLRLWLVDLSANGCHQLAQCLHRLGVRIFDVA